MIETSALARPYALAAYDQADSEKALPAWSEALELIAGVVADGAMRDAIANPRVDQHSLTDILLGVCEGHLSPTQQNFVRLLIQSDRLTLAGSIHDLFERERAKSEGRVNVSVTSAFKLNAKQQKVIAAMMSKRLGREVDLEVSVDKTLIGGVLIRTGDVVIDASLRGRLRQLESTFA
jgi:F-type H+-transporting ATPase subunit delta